MSADFFVLSLSLTVVLIFYAALVVILLICPALYKVYKVLKCAAIEPSWTAQVVTINWMGNGKKRQVFQLNENQKNNNKHKRYRERERGKESNSTHMCFHGDKKFGMKILGVYFEYFMKRRMKKATFARAGCGNNNGNCTSGRGRMKEG